MPVEAAIDSPENRCAVRRSGRQSKRTDKLEEFLSTAKRGSRRSAPPSVESGDPPSQTPTDAETASEASFDGNADTKVAEDKVESPERRTRSGARKQTQQKTRGGRKTRGGSGEAVKDEGSSENEEDNKEQLMDENACQNCEGVGDNNTAQPQPEQDSEKTAFSEEEKKEDGEKNEEETEKDSDKETDEDDAENPAGGMAKRGPIRTYINKKRVVNKNNAPVKAPSPAIKNALPVKREVKPKITPTVGKIQKQQTQEENDEMDENDDDDDDDDDSSTSSSSSSIDSDEGGYDPNALYCICRQKHNKRFMICCDRCEEWFHGDCVGITEARGRLMERNGEDYICPNCTVKKNQVVRPATSNLYPEIGKPKADAAHPVSALTFSATNDKTTTSGIDTSLTAAQAAAMPPSSTSAGSEDRASEDQGIKGRIEKATNPTGKKKIKIFQPAAEDSSLPKCIGPGCDNNAQPDSVYCGNDCILRHAAAAMKSITDVKEPKQKEKKSGAGGKKTQKKSQEESDSEEDHSTDPDEDDEDEHAEEQPPPPATASWSSDHNYIAVTPEKTTPISPTVLNKKCMYLFKGLGLTHLFDLNCKICTGN
uniref:PHD-type domain-containing protein n=1 Tax=Labrus bergylta TaxID=56723 RepID=A0A3Q3FQG5_9LABR